MYSIYIWLPYERIHHWKEHNFTEPIFTTYYSLSIHTNLPAPSFKRFFFFYFQNVLMMDFKFSVFSKSQ